jgi:hypothetical protein
MTRKLGRHRKTETDGDRTGFSILVFEFGHSTVSDIITQGIHYAIFQDAKFLCNDK